MFELEDIIDHPIHCKTLEEAEELLQILDDKNIKWINGDKLIEDTTWSEYGSGTCYRYNPNQGGVTRGNYNWYKEERLYKSIIGFSELMGPEEKIEPTPILSPEERKKLLVNMIKQENKKEKE